MIFTQENEYSAVLDACVLVPMPLCDLLLRLGEEPELYRPLWSSEILAELGRTLTTKLGRSQKQISWRLEQMQAAFPEAMVAVPSALLKAADCVPDKNDRHVLAAAIAARANVIVTQNKKHFPAPCLDQYGVFCQNADEFLINQYHLNPTLVLRKLGEQAAAIDQSRKYVVSRLKLVAPALCTLLEEHGL